MTWITPARIHLQGGLVTVTDDASLHMWNLRQKQPALIHSLKFNKEKYVSFRVSSFIVRVAEEYWCLLVVL